MSVYKHHYRAYTGKLTPVWTRIFVLARYGYAEAWSSRITVGLFTLSMLPCLLFLFAIYFANNPVAKLLLGLRTQNVLAINAGFFLNVLRFQSVPALILASWIAPRLITFDLADDALPILLSHPISRFGYVFGKWVALFASLSLVTWIPSLLLFAYQCYSSPQPWALGNLPIAGGMVAGSVIWIAFLSLLGLALSSWVKWRVVATGAIVAAILVPAGVGGIVSAVLRTKWGLLLNFPFMMSALWQRLLGVPDLFSSKAYLPTAGISAMFTLACLLCLAMLYKRIRAREVVRG
jgi:ABC-type transport system involved in multi-copper enzyme maturation permease subunit